MLLPLYTQPDPETFHPSHFQIEKANSVTSNACAVYESSCNLFSSVIVKQMAPDALIISIEATQVMSTLFSNIPKLLMSIFNISGYFHIFEVHTLFKLPVLKTWTCHDYLKTSIPRDIYTMHYPARSCINSNANQNQDSPWMNIANFKSSHYLC
uniref:Uncharacterized protein n=1 Tax=Rhizophora mucronata TaxID=61149 RepID=A0A2P2N351_RHIMU